MNSILKNMARVSLFLAISVGAMANLDEGRWVPKNREVLDKVISESKIKEIMQYLIGTIHQYIKIHKKIYSDTKSII